MKAFLSGFAIGTAAAMLIAPKPGRELRQQLRRRIPSTERDQAADADEGTQENSRRERRSVGDNTLNTVSRDQLLSVYGIGPVLADRIIENRPYGDAHEVVERGILPESTFAQLESDLLRKPV
jgi:DNA uptake protein ComE-like DNA-binding protein